MTTTRVNATLRTLAIVGGLAVGCSEASKPAADASGDTAGETADGTDGATTCAAARAIRLDDLPGGAALLRGPQVVARASGGDVLLDNARVRFVVRGGSTGVAIYGTTGGHLVDAGRVPAGADFRLAVGPSDDLREIAIAVDMHVLRPTAVEVLDDGCAGVARVRVRGELVQFPTLQEALGLATPAVEVEHVYSLAAGSNALEIATTLRPKAGTDGKALAKVLIADVLFWGGEVAMYLPGHGDHKLPTTSLSDTVGLTPRRAVGGVVAAPGATGAASAAQAGTAYAFASAKKLSSIDAGAIHAFLHGNVSVPAEGLTVTRTLAADVDLAAAMAGARATAGLNVPTRSVAGSVAAATSAAGAGVDAALVVEAIDAKGKAVTRCSVSPARAFACAVPTTTVSLRSGWLGDGGGGLGGLGQIDADSDLKLPDGDGDALGLALAAPQPAMLHIVATAAGKPLPVRVTLWPKGKLGDPKGQGDKEYRRVFADVDGSGSHAVPPGVYDVYVHHGPTFSAHSEEVVLTQGKATTVTAVLSEVVATEGWIAMDSHVHAEQSSDSTLPVELRAAQAVAEGLGYLIATDHDHLTDYRHWHDQSPLLAPAPGACGATLVGSGGKDAASTVLRTAVGVEVSTIHQGHFNVWPAAPVAWYQLDVGGLFDALGAGDPGRFVQCNHPHFESFSYFKAIGFDAASTGKDKLRCDGIELINGIDHKATPAVVQDWLKLLARGIRIVGVGTSDCHGDSDFVGNPRTWVYVGEAASKAAASDPCALDNAAIDGALRAGRAVASAGPMLWLSAKRGEGAAAATAQVGETLPKGSGPVTVQARLRAPAWLPLGRLQLWIGAAGGAVSLAADVDLQGVAVVAGAREHVVDLPVAATVTAGFAVAVHVPGASASPGTHRPSWAVANPVFW